MSKDISRRVFLKYVGLGVGATLAQPFPALADKENKKPNIVLIYADDLGYGDVSCYGATKISTPNIDKLASNSVQFTNAHSPSATCTPSRYAMLTGEYAWRKEGTGILFGSAGMIIKPGRKTLPLMLQKAGYKTAVIGKWHLGLGAGNLNWNSDIIPGPLDIGFDYSYLIPATGDRVPCVYVEDRKVVNLDPKDPIKISKDPIDNYYPTGKDNPELLKMLPSHGHDNTIINGISRIGYMSGGRKALWDDEKIADHITDKAKEFISRNKDVPFFLYFSTQDIHVPRVPGPGFAGKSGLGPRGDVILQLDDCVGQIMDSLKRHKLEKDTIVIFTSDNGPVLDDGYQDDAVIKQNGHEPGGPLRGGKYSSFDAGTRVPFLVSCPGTINPRKSDALICQIDLFASFTKFTGQNLTNNEAPDSFELLDALFGKTETGRDHLVEHGFFTLSIIKGDWKFIKPRKGPNRAWQTGIESGVSLKPQLYNLKDDIGEKNNLANKYPEITQKLTSLLEKIETQGYSRSNYHQIINRKV